MSRPMVKLSAAFLLGLVVGVTALCLLSARASRLYVQMVRLSFASEEEGLLASAWNRGDFHGAARHAACGIEAESERSSFAPGNALWDFGFPAMGLWVNDRTTYPVGDRTGLLALAHARMGKVLEKLGKADEAAKEYAEAALLGGGDAAKWRATASVTLRDAEGPRPPR